MSKVVMSFLKKHLKAEIWQIYNFFNNIGVKVDLNMAQNIKHKT